MNGKQARSVHAAAETNEHRYLELLAKVKKALDTAQEIVVATTDIRPYPTQPRDYFNEESIRRLAESIDAGGQTSSGMIREKVAETRYELIDGERRWRAINTIPAAQRPLYRAKLIVAEEDVVQYLISGITNFNREGHTPLEMMKTIDRHIDFGFPMKEVAKLIGISEHWAYQIHGLKKLEPKVLALLDPGLPRKQQLPISAAMAIAKIDRPYQFALADRVINKKVSLANLRGEVIRTAKKAGTTVRVREVRGDQQWESFGNKAEVISRNASDAHSILKKGIVDRFARNDPPEAARLLRKLRDARETIETIEARLQGILKPSAIA